MSMLTALDPQQIKAYISSGQTDKAIDLIAVLLESALSQLTNQELLSFGRVCQSRGQLPLAIRFFSYLLSRRTELTTEACCGAVTSFMSLDDYESATRLIKLTIKKKLNHGQDYALYLLEAECYLRDSQIAKSASLLKKLIQIHQEPRALTLYGESLLRLGQYEHALSILSGISDTLYKQKALYLQALLFRDIEDYNSSLICAGEAFKLNLLDYPSFFVYKEVLHATSLVPSNSKKILANNGSKTELVDRVLSLMTASHTNRNLIRIGGTENGSYIIPDDLEGIYDCFSPGAGEFNPFDNELSAIYSIRSHLLDPAQGKFRLHKLHTFTKGYLGLKDGPVDLHHPGFTISAQSLSLRSWINSIVRDPTSDLILQMDIEGGEYPVLLDMDLHLQSRFRIIVLELHHLSLVKTPSACCAVLIPLLEKLLSTHILVSNVPTILSDVVYSNDRQTLHWAHELAFYRR